MQPIRSNSSSTDWIESQYARWSQNPSSVDSSWQEYFQAMEGSNGSAKTSTSASASAAAPDVSDAERLNMENAMKATLMMRAFAVRGHFLAKTDPLELAKVKEVPADLELAYYGWSDADLDQLVYTGHSGLDTFGAHQGGFVTLRTLRDMLHRSYCGAIGYEFMHIAETEVVNWIRSRVERPVPYSFDAETKRVIHDRLAWAGLFEKFLGRKFQEKRFGLDGSDSFIVGLKALIDRASAHGVGAINLGMAHRGRLNVLANVVRKPLEAIFAEFHGRSYLSDDWGSSGDVKYHLGTSYDRPTRTSRNVAISLLANPSHLEAVNPLVEGKTYAKQFYSGDREKKKAMSVLVHGDASFAGQGVVYETLNLSTLADYSTGGCIHVIINNQIGFTTLPDQSRSGVHCTDVAKSIGAPIFHVNGDDPEAVVHCMEMAADFRAKFGRDVVVDIVGYRRYGHNEVDQPKFTQPVMYTKIEQTKEVLELYEARLVAEGVLTPDSAQKVRSSVEETLSTALEKSATYVTNRRDWLESRWKQFFPTKPGQASRAISPQTTAVSEQDLRFVGENLTNIPPGFTVHKALGKILANKKKAISNASNIDWATAEALAFGTLAIEGVHVRLSGQDVERGTFSQRHAVMHDQVNGESYTPLQHLRYDQAAVHICNSSLSEFAVLGFETGFSMENPMALVMWEAQFGDFVNGAQIIIDQFLTSGERKWNRQCGLTLLLPHGYEGAGPEHSSCRPERFLMACDQDPLNWAESGDRIQKANIQVVNPTTPAQYFHVLRRQVMRGFRKPLIVLTPKSLLKHRECVSTLDEMSFDMTNSQETFAQVLDEVEPNEIVAPEKVKEVVLCTGKVYYDIRNHRREKGLKNMAIVRVEQIAPFPMVEVKEILEKYPKARLTWCQEESFNMGYYHHVFFHLGNLTEGKRPLRYVGRPASASPAAGSGARHRAELSKFLAELE